MSTGERYSNGDGDSAVALGLVGGGTIVFLAGVLFGSRLVRLVGLLAGIGGGALLVAERMREREERIDQAQEHIGEELANLDPVARAQVIARLESETAGS